MQQSAETQKIKVLYLAVGNETLYREVRGYVPDGVDLVTLDTGDAAEVLQKLADCRVVIAGTRKLTREMIAAATQLQLVIHQGVGYHDTVDVPALVERGIPVAITPDGTPATVSEHAIMLMLASCRLLPFADAELRVGRYHVNALRLQSRTLSGCTIGIIGMGRVGRAVAARLQGWETDCLYTDPIVLSTEEEAALRLKRVDLDTLLRQADIVTLHVPLTEDTRALINAERLRLMKPGAVLINTARGPVVDEQALISALQDGHLGAAGLDVYEREPLEAGHPLADFQNVVLTPHIASATRDTFACKMRGVFTNIARHLAGQPLNNRVL